MSRLASWEFRGNARFEVERRLGGGGMGVVYRVLDRERNRRVALKTLQRVSPSTIYRFKKEFRALAGVSHENLVTLHELFSAGDTWFFTMELLEGASFLEWVRPEPPPGDDDEPTVIDQGPPTSTPHPLDEARLRDALIQLAHGLIALHDAGKLHRDIKPSNVMVTPAGRVVLLDFGLSADLDEDSLAKSHLGDVVGTVAYMAPEQASGDVLAPPSDWYSVGVVLYQALTGELPFSGTLYQVVLEKQKREPPPADERVPGLPKDLVRLAADLLRTAPEARPNGREVLRRLGALTPRSTGPSVLTRSFPDLSPPFVGREAHKKALRRAFEASQSGAVVVHVEGTSGIGKTALVRNFLEEAHKKRGAAVFSGRCYEHELVPYKALDHLVDSISRWLRRRPDPEVQAILPSDVRALARVFPVLNRVESIQLASSRGFDAPDPQELRRRAFAAFRELMVKIGKERPVVMALDDLQWGDGDSAALLNDLLAPPNPPPLLLLAAYRSEDRDSSELLRTLRTTTEGGFQIRELLLGPLDHAAAEHLARRILQGPPSEADLRDDDVSADIADTLPKMSPSELAVRAEAIARESGGNPLFVFELAIHANAELDEAEVRPTLDPKVTMDEVVARRYGGLPADAKRLLDVLAVAGRPIPREVAFRAAGIEPKDPTPGAALVTAHLARSRSAGEREELETFHDRVRDAVRARLDPDTVRAHHQALARALSSDVLSVPGDVVFHLQGAGEGDRAAQAAFAAAERSRGALAFDQAVKLSEIALDLSTEERSRFQLLKARAEALEEACRPEAAEAYESAADAAPTPERALEMRRRAAEQYLRSGRVEAGIDALRPVLTAHEMDLPSTSERALAELRVHRSRLLMRGLDFEQTPLAERNRALLAKADACWSASVGLTMVDVLTSSIFTTRYLHLSLDAGDPSRIARALAMELAFLTSEGKRSPTRIRRVLETLAELSKRDDAPYVRAFASLGAGFAALHEGEWAEAERRCRTTEHLLREHCVGVDWELDTARTIATWARAYRGELDGLAAEVSAGIRDAQARGSLYAATILSMSANASIAFLAADDVHSAVHHLETAKRASSQAGFYLQSFWEISSRLQLDLYTGEGTAAWTRVSKAWPALVDSHLTRVQVIRSEALFLRARAALAAVVEDPAHRPLLSLARTDAEGLAREGMRWTDPLAKLVEALVARALGLGSESAEQLEEAAAGFEAADMFLHAAVSRVRHAETLRGAAGRKKRQEALEVIAGMGVRAPEKMVRLIAPSR